MRYANLFLGIVLNVVGQFLFRWWATDGRWWIFALGLVCFNLDAIAWARSLKLGISFVETGLWWDSGAMFLLLLGNWLLFRWQPRLDVLLFVLLAFTFIIATKRAETS